MEYKGYWYDDQNTIMEHRIISADNEEDARKKFYALYNGDPPLKLLSIVRCAEAHLL